MKNLFHFEMGGGGVWQMLTSSGGSLNADIAKILLTSYSYVNAPLLLNQNWGRALGKSLDHFTLRGRAQSGLLRRPLSISLGVHDPPGYGPVLYPFFLVLPFFALFLEW